MSENAIVEVKGIKLNVDLSNTMGQEPLRVGSRVKVLVKEYSESYKPYPGIIVGFDNFRNLPTINVAYCKMEYNESSIIFVSINAKSDPDVEIIPDRNDKGLEVNKSEVLRRMDRKIDSLRNEVAELEAKKDFFLRSFGKWFVDAAPVFVPVDEETERHF